MSKIIEEIRDQIALEIGDSNQPAVYTVPEFNRAVRLAYNRAIDDSLELWYNPTSLEDQDTFDRDLKSLRI